MFSNEQLKLFLKVQKCSAQRGVKVYIVGGMIRDLFLGHDPSDKDVDFIVEGNAIEFAAFCRNETGGILKEFPDFITAKITGLVDFGVIGEIDFASSRTEVYEKPGKLPKVQLAPIMEDLRRRDFSINALAIDLNEIISWSQKGGAPLSELALKVLDFFSGMPDLESKSIRILHERSFEDDPTRIFRAIRYAARIGGSIEKISETKLANAVSMGCLDMISNQRKINELKKILSEKEHAEALGLLIKYGVSDKLNLFDSKNIDQIIKYLKLAFNQAANNQDLLYQTALRIFYYFSSEGREISLGLGSNELKKLRFDARADLDITDKQTLQRLSEPGKLFQGLLHMK